MATKKRVAVVGTGTVGSQAAWRLAARGAEVVAFDRFAPGHDRSAAGGETRVFRSVQTDDGRYVPLVRHADALWKQLQAETAANCAGSPAACSWARPTTSRCAP